MDESDDILRAADTWARRITNAKFVLGLQGPRIAE